MYSHILHILNYIYTYTLNLKCTKWNKVEAVQINFFGDPDSISLQNRRKKSKRISLLALKLISMIDCRRFLENWGWFLLEFTIKLLYLRTLSPWYFLKKSLNLYSELGHLPYSVYYRLNATKIELIYTQSSHRSKMYGRFIRFCNLLSF